MQANMVGGPTGQTLEAPGNAIRSAAGGVGNATTASSSTYLGQSSFWSLLVIYIFFSIKYKCVLISIEIAASLLFYIFLPYINTTLYRSVRLWSFQDRHMDIMYYAS